MSTLPSPEIITVVLVLTLGIVMVGRIFWLLNRSYRKLQLDQSTDRHPYLKDNS